VHVYAGHPARAAQINSLLPDDHLLQAEIGLAAALMSREEANALVGRLYAEYSERLDQGDAGWRYEEAYDCETGRLVNAEYEQVIQDVRAELTKFGLALDSVQGTVEMQT
jgi:hypothetical protein